LSQLETFSILTILVATGLTESVLESLEERQRVKNRIQFILVS